MKKMKKTISLILAVIMLLSIVPMQSFALFDWLEPEVVKIEALDNNPISNQFVQNNQYGGLCHFYGDEGCGDYKYKVHFSNGKTKEFGYDDYEPSGKFDNIEYAYAVMIADADKCAQAVAEGKATVEVEVVVGVYYKRNNNYEESVFTLEKPIVDKIVTDIKLVGKVPTVYNTDWPVDDFIGKKFKVSFADGRKETYTLKTAKDGYVLGDNYVNLWFGEDEYIDAETGETVYYKGLDIVYMDCVAPIEREYLPCKYQSIEITDFKLNGKGGISEISYKLTYKNGKVIEKTCVPEEPIDYDDYYVVIDTVDDFEIYFFVDSDYDYYYTEIWMGYSIWGIYDYEEYDNVEDFCDCRCHKDGLLNFIINAFLMKIWQVFGINEQCQCGCWHW